MPELIENGPNIPVHLLNELDEGKIVFFAGAGISVGGNSKLPTFSRLIKEVYETVREEPDPLEKGALDWANKDQDDWKPPFPDQAFQLLERKIRMGREGVRKIVVELLSAKPAGPLPIHKAILDLSGSENEFRLVTTNFDNRFCQATDRALPIDTAPRLPVAKPDRWKGLVYLHGSISTANVNDLVLTSADFGEAYLTHGWATQFVTDLFRNFTVVFVGYSIDDTVMRYLLDAMATNRSNEKQSDEFMPAYAFASFGGKHGCKPEVQIQWESKGVKPILFENSDNDYSYLNNTLIEWARVHKNPIDSRKNIVLEGLQKNPKDESDSVVERVLWALQKSTDVATTVAEQSHTENDITSSESVASWLDVFFAHGFIGQPILNYTSDESLIFDPEPPANAAKIKTKYQHSESVENQLIQWILKYLHIPQVFASIYQHYFQLPQKYLMEFRIALVRDYKKISNSSDLDLWHRWFVLLNNGRPTRSNVEFLVQHHGYAEISNNDRHLIEDQLINYIAPKLSIKAHPTADFLESYFSGRQKEPVHRSDYDFNLVVVFGEEDLWPSIECILEKREFRIRYAETLTDYLERAIQLIRIRTEQISDNNLRKTNFDLLTYRPSIEDHKQNKWQNKSMKFVDYVRDSYIDLMDGDKPRAKCLLLRWMNSDELLFKRLALHAITEDENADIQHLRQLLLEGEYPGLFDKELKRETLRLLRKAGGRLKEIQTEIRKTLRADMS